MDNKDKIIKKRGKEVVDIVDSLGKIKDADNIKELEKRLKAAKARNKKAEDKQITKLIDEVSYSKKIKEIFKMTNDKNLIGNIVKMQIEKNKESVDFLEKLKEHLLNNEIEIVHELLGMEYSEVEKNKTDEFEDKKDISDENIEKKEEDTRDENYNYSEEE